MCNVSECDCVSFIMGRPWLQTRRSRVRFPKVSLEFFIDIIFPALGLTQSLTQMSTRNISWGVNAAGA